MVGKSLYHLSKKLGTSCNCTVTKKSLQTISKNILSKALIFNENNKIKTF